MSVGSGARRQQFQLITLTETITAADQITGESNMLFANGTGRCPHLVSPMIIGHDRHAGWGRALTLQSAGAGATPAVVLNGVMPAMVFDLALAPQ